MHILAVSPDIKLLAALTQGITALSVACKAGAIRGCFTDSRVCQRDQYRKKGPSAIRRRRLLRGHTHLRIPAARSLRIRTCDASKLAY